MSDKKINLSASKKRQEKEKKKEKILKAIIIASASVFAAAAIILLAVFVIKPAVEKKKAEKEREQTTVSASEAQQGEYGEYMGCRMPSEFSQLLNQSDIESEKACSESGVAAEINGHKLSVPEYALYYYRAETDYLMKAVNSVSERGQNLTGFDPSKAPSAQNYPKGEIKWSSKINEDIAAEIGRDYFLFDEAIKSGFMPSQEKLDEISELFEFIALAANGYSSLDDYVAEKYSEGLTFAMFAKREIVIDYAEAYEEKLCENKAESYSKSFVDGIFNNSPEKYKNVTVNILPIENKADVAEAKKVTNFSGFCSFAKKIVGSADFDPEIHTESYKVTYESVAEYYGDTVAEWIFSSERKVGDTGVVTGAVYNCLVCIRELPEVTHSSSILMMKVDSDESKPIDDAYSEAEAAYKELGAEKMTEEAFRNYLSENSSDYEITVYVNAFAPELDKWIHSSERKQGDSICFKGEESAYVVMFLKDNPEDYYSDALIRKSTAEDEIKKYIEGNSYTLSANDKPMKKSIEAAEAKYIAYYQANKEKIGI